MVAVIMLMHGEPLYGAAGLEAVLSALRHTTFSVHVALPSDMVSVLPRSRRVYPHILPAHTLHDRADRFLLKFQALRQFLPDVREPYVIQMDADAMFCRSVTAAEVVGALAGSPMGMVEQETITGSDVDRAALCTHFCRYSFKVIGDAESPPSRSSFRYFNSGVVLAETGEMRRLAAWALERKERRNREHVMGEQMVADQDYFQFWTNVLHPGRCRVLPWTWNHCEHWDTGFPRKGATILHFSNFAIGPGSETLSRMREVRGPMSWRYRCAMALRSAGHLLQPKGWHG